MLDNPSGLRFAIAGKTISDGHSYNIVLCRCEGELRVEIIDGKLGSPVQGSQPAYVRRRLQWERTPNHRWLLHNYAKVLES